MTDNDMVTQTCSKCGQEVVRRPGGFFWILPDEVGQQMVKLCPMGSIHNVDNDDMFDDDD